jgi:adenosylmethionine-8-amino-7-oxononanoate aminotransferase
MMMDNIHIEAPDCYRCPYGKQRDCCQCECFEKAEKAFAKHGHETAAMIAEPLLQGSAGMRIYPPLYLKKLRGLCDKYDVKLILDEIATGFGRTGTMFACEQAGISPDILCISKGLTGGYLPMSVTCVSEEIYDAFYADYSEGRAFMHSHTYAGNPLAASVANATLKIMERDNILEEANEKAIWLNNRFHEIFDSHPNVGEIRQMGLINAIELVEDKDSKKGFDSSERIGYKIYREALKQGLMLRPLGNVMYFNPPLVITKKELEESLRICKEAIDSVLL